MSIFNTVPNKKTDRWMFFGERPNTARSDELVHPIFDKLTQTMKSFFWQPEEIPLARDVSDFRSMNSVYKHVFVSTISYQIILDTIQGRAPALALLPHCSLPELEGCIDWWQAFENLHSHSYGYVLKNVFSNPGEVFDNIVVDEYIINRARTTVGYYDEWIQASIKYQAGIPDCTMRELKRKLLMCVVSINALEGLSFYASFACTFAFAEQGLMVGNSDQIALIARDEALHLAITQNILKKWRNGEDDPEMVELYQECLPEIRALYENVVEQEKEWCKYLFRDGSMLGLNANILGEYVEHIAGKRMRAIGLKSDYSTKNPLTWMDKYLNSGDVQESPQEKALTSYTIGGVKNDVEDGDFSDFTF